MNSLDRPVWGGFFIEGIFSGERNALVRPVVLLYNYSFLFVRFECYGFTTRAFRLNDDQELL
jgi:hypothetical protein